MKTRYCYNCQRPLKEQVDTCSKCGFDNSVNHLKNLEIHQRKSYCYKQLKKDKAIINQALCFLIIGFILLVIGAVFLVLSFRYDVIGARVFTPSSMEFIVSMLSLSISLILFTLFLLRFIPTKKRIKFYTDELAELKGDATSK